MKAVPVDLKKLSDVLDSDVVKKTVHNKLLKKVKAIDTNTHAKKTNDHAKTKEIKYKIASASDLVTKADFNAKINEIKGEIPIVSDLVKTNII